MYIKVCFLLVCIMCCVWGHPDQRNSYNGESDEHGEYEFGWVVNNDYYNNHFGHREQRDGDNTQGSYFVYLPDGRTQKVTYFVNGDSGFVAEVSYEGEATNSHPQPSYD